MRTIKEIQLDIDQLTSELEGDISIEEKMDIDCQLDDLYDELDFTILHQE